MPILKTKWRRSIAVLLCVMLMFCAAFSLTAYADSAVITTGTMYSYFQTYNTSGVWVDLQTPGHATSDGQVAYCLQTSKDNPYNAAYFSAVFHYTSSVQKLPLRVQFKLTTPVIVSIMPLSTEKSGSRRKLIMAKCTHCPQKPLCQAVFRGCYFVHRIKPVVLSFLSIQELIRCAPWLQMGVWQSRLFRFICFLRIDGYPCFVID